MELDNLVLDQYADDTIIEAQFLLFEFDYQNGLLMSWQRYFSGQPSGTFEFEYISDQFLSGVYQYNDGASGPELFSIEEFHYYGDLSLKEHEEEVVITLFPNPSKDFINIDTETEVLSVELFDLNGLLLMRQKGETTLNIKNLSPGVYQVKVNTSKGAKAIKFVKE